MLMKCVSIEQSMWDRDKLVDIVLVQRLGGQAKGMCRQRLTLPVELAEGYVVGATYNVPAPVRVVAES